MTRSDLERLWIEGGCTEPLRLVSWPNDDTPVRVPPLRFVSVQDEQEWKRKDYMGQGHDLAPGG